MAVTTFDQIYNEAVKKGLIQKSVDDAKSWFRFTATNTLVEPQKLMSDTERNYGWTLSRSDLTDSAIGKMYLFNYDPKTKATLPYYDIFPLIFPIDKTEKGFLGINMHYLPPILRASLMDKLQTTMTNDRYDSKTKLQINYQILKSASQFSLFRPCIKQYLFSHVQSKFMQVPAKAWNIVLFLPLARFQKASQAKVWADSRQIIKRYNT